MSSKVVIVDYGMGNLNSVKKMTDRLRVESVISSDSKIISSSEKIILPGIGHFGKAMANLKQLNLLDALHEAVLVKKKPTLGICLGMQLFAEKSEEGDSEGLGWLKAKAVKFAVSDKLKYKIPHLGWNQMRVRKKSVLLKDVPETAEFYFVHSYYLRLENQSDALGETKYADVFTAAVERENLFGVQFHPEKSRDAGTQLLKNFIEL